NGLTLQPMCLALPLLDDAARRRLLPLRLTRLVPIAARDPRARRAARLALGALTLIIVFCSLVGMDMRFGGNPPAAAQAVDRFIEPLHIVNSYGLFAIMT